ALDWDETHVEGSDEFCFWHDGKIYFADRFRPKWQKPIPCTWPVLGVSADRSRAVVRLPGKKWHERTFAVADLRKNELLAKYEMSVVAGSKWAFSADGRWVVPLDGVGTDSFFFFDVLGKKVHQRKLLNQQKDPSLYWTGARVEGNDVCFFVRQHH